MNVDRRQAIAATIVCLAAPARAQPWAPGKPTTLVVPVAPGSSNDLIARILAERLAGPLGQPVVVENKPGAAAMIGTGVVARAAPDGHTIGIAPSNIYIAPHLPGKPGGSLDVLRDLRPIVTAGTSPVLIVASPAIGVKTPAQLLAWLREQGGASYATSGPGSPMHVAGELFRRVTRTDLNHVPYRGVIPAVNAVMGGEVPIAFTALGGINPFIASGRIVPIAVAEATRSPLLPGVPTLAESGIAGVETNVFFQLLAPAATPGEIVERWNVEINRVLAAADVVERLRQVGVQVVGGSAAEARRRAEENHARYGQLVREFRITGD